MTACNMVTGWRTIEYADGDIAPGDEIECGEPVWLPSESGGGYCRKHADETAADGLDCFTRADAAAYVALLAEAK